MRFWWGIHSHLDPAGTSRTQPVEVCFMQSPHSSGPCLHTLHIEVRLIGCQVISRLFGATSIGDYDTE